LRKSRSEISASDVMDVIKSAEKNYVFAFAVGAGDRGFAETKKVEKKAKERGLPSPRKSHDPN